jgi:hypothetical protein
MEMRIDAHRTVRMPKEESGSMVSPVEGTSVLRRDALDDGGKGLVRDLNDQVRFLLRPRECMHTNAVPGHRTRRDRFETSAIHVVKEDRVIRVAAKNDVVSRACDVLVLLACHPWSACCCNGSICILH